MNKNKTITVVIGVGGILISATLGSIFNITAISTLGGMITGSIVVLRILEN